MDFYIDGELCLSEQLESSWRPDGTPTKAGGAAAQQKRKAVAALHDDWAQTGYPHRQYNEETGCVDIDSDAERAAEAHARRVAHGSEHKRRPPLTWDTAWDD